MPTVIKSNGYRTAYDREKIRTGFMRALHKRPVPTDNVDDAINRVEARILALGEREIKSRTIGELVMRELKKLDDVAYIRFASVYEDFQRVDDFRDAILQVKRPGRKTRRQGTLGDFRPRALMFSPADQQHMAEALRLAEKGLFTATPNPRVGCVIVRDGDAVGAGWHEKAGGPHAEIVALARRGRAGARRDRVRVAGALQPPRPHAALRRRADRSRNCARSRGDAGSEFSGRRQRLRRLRAAGIQVESGLMQDEARALNIGFVARMSRGRPWVRMKIAASLDGRTALANGRSQWITGPEARRDGHAWRARACAVLTGIGTVRDDDPQLNVREVETPRQPLKVVVDSRLQLPLSAKMLASGKVLVAAAVEDKAAIAALHDKGAEVVVLPNARGKVELARTDARARAARAQRSARRGRLQVERLAARRGTGGRIAGLSRAQHSRRRRYGMFSLPELADLAQKRLVQFADVQTIGSDLRILARVNVN